LELSADSPNAPQFMSTIQIAEPQELRSELTNRTATSDSNPLQRATPALVFLIAMVYLCLFRRFSSRDLDEGIILQAAERVLRGQVPYRDFFIFYTPGSFYLQAAMFKVFGDSLAVARTGIAFVGAACSAVTYCLARRVCSRKISLLAGALTAGFSVTYRFVVVHNWYSTFFTSLAIYAAVRLLESGKKRWAFLTGSLATLTVLVEQSKGPALYGGLALGYLILLAARRKGLPTSSSIVAFAFGSIWPWAPTLLYFASKHSIAVMLQDWFWPLHHYTQANHVFYGHLSLAEDVRDSLYTGALWVRIWKYVTLSPLLVIPVLPLVGVVWLIFSVKRLWTNKHSSPETAYYVLMGAIGFGLLLSILIVRTDITDFVYLAPIWYVVLAWTLQEGESKYTLLQKLRPYLLVYICIAFGMMSFALLLSVNGAPVRIHTRRGVVETTNEETVIPFVQARVPPGHELFVYPYLPLYNYLTATHSPTPLDYFQAGMNTQEQAQNMIETLRRRRTRWVLFDPEFIGRIPYVWPHTPIAAIASDPVADFIAGHYRVCQVLSAGPGLLFHFMVLKDENCAALPPTLSSVTQ
jgi:4-amino-4-deoxy-L-arabinose transferase-like glycosyltransferase